MKKLLLICIKVILTIIVTAFGTAMVLAVQVYCPDLAVYEACSPITTYDIFKAGCLFALFSTVVWGLAKALGWVTYNAFAPWIVAAFATWVGLFVYVCILVVP